MVDDDSEKDKDSLLARKEADTERTAQFREEQQRSQAEEREYRRAREKARDDAERQRSEERRLIERERFELRQEQAARASALNAAASFCSGDETAMLAMADRLAKWIKS